MAEHGTFYWNELMTRDTARAKDFYGKTLGWTFSDMPMGEPFGTYHVAMIGEKMVGGMMTMPPGPMFDGIPEHWFCYIAVDDLDARLAKLKAEGGTVIREPFDVDGVGRIAIVSDPGGAAQGWMVPVPM
ncbi:VOC family protein [Kaistia dalseonensis]|uniref:Enzyme related to lactoylglutathione lyase n=1 Tax=Kaistia dalseonensis TaxID=410840 RepID=A0ABU0H618_9HYPH|nr:VOC family protein [Kaistia dalseonensis]MCX5494891.1 VOC family protein [Kaistia dalseonensis]MDQ0437472.1 putative enzyme related to lactoylglutathione lyase [Kaistia dalseonensis]